MNCICNGKRFKINAHTWSSDSLTIKDGNILSIEGTVACGYENCDFELDVEIKFCPFCGKKIISSM